MESVGKLRSAGIEFPIIRVESTEDFITVGEASEEVARSGMDILPVLEYEGVIVCSRSYPTDQELVDYIDVPEGVLSAKRASLPAANEMEFSCNVCFKR